MKKILAILLPILFVLISFNACSDDEDERKIYFFYSTQEGEPASEKLKSITITYYKLMPRHAGYITVAGGEGNYTAKSSDQSIIEDSSIEFERKPSNSITTMSFALKKEGTVIITVTDEKGNSGKLKIAATVLTQELEVEDTSITTNSEISKTIRTEIEADIKANNLNENNYITLRYESYKEGTFTVSSTPDSEDIRFGGAFRIEKNEETVELSLFLNYNNIEHRYNILHQGEISPKAVGPSRVNFIEDLTEFYKAKYPAENITEVSYILKFRIHR